MKRGQYAELSVQQSEGLAEVDLSQPDGEKADPRLNDAGKGSLIRVPVIAEEDGVYSVRVALHVAAPGGSGTITISPPHPATARDRQRLLAEDLYARAEMFRRTGDRKTWPQALRDYDQVIEEARPFEDTVLLRAALTGKSRLYLYRLNDYKASLAVAREAVAISAHDGDLAGQA